MLTSPAPGGQEPEGGEPYQLTAQQIAYFETFGFVKVPGLFADDMGWITESFEEIFATATHWETNEELHFDQRRLIVPGFVERNERLATITRDPRVVGVVNSLIGERAEYAQSDGNLFYCDTSWHADNYEAPMTIYHVKLSFYLDSLHGSSGAIRLLPGTNFHDSPYAQTLRRNLRKPGAIEEIYGTKPEELPAWTMDSEPGDVIVWNFRTVHASFNGGERRRLFSLNFREAVDPEPAPAP